MLSAHTTAHTPDTHVGPGRPTRPRARPTHRASGSARRRSTPKFTIRGSMFDRDSHPHEPASGVTSLLSQPTRQPRFYLVSAPSRLFIQPRLHDSAGRKGMHRPLPQPHVSNVMLGKREEGHERAASERPRPQTQTGSEASCGPPIAALEAPHPVFVKVEVVAVVRSAALLE